MKVGRLEAARVPERRVRVLFDFGQQAGPGPFSPRPTGRSDIQGPVRRDFVAEATLLRAVTHGNHPAATIHREGTLGKSAAATIHRQRTRGELQAATIHRLRTRGELQAATIHRQRTGPEVSGRRDSPCRTTLVAPGTPRFKVK